jgi:SAM-dependent methyltransferase
VGAYFLDVQTSLVLDLLAPWPGATVLDVGGGHAQLAGPLAEHGFSVTVTGTSDACRARLDRLLRPGSFRFRRCDSLALPWEAGAFDVVVAFRLLPHVERWRRLLEEMCRVAGRAILVDYPDVRSFNAVAERLFSWKKAWERNTRPFRCFSRRELADPIARSGFGRTRLEPEFFAPMVLHRMLGSRALSEAFEGAGRGLGLTRAFGSPVVLRAERLEPR